MIAEAAKAPTFNGGQWLHPRQVLRELEKAMPPRVMVSTDIGNINSVANSYLRFEEPRSFFAPMSFGNCGYALPTIIGAKRAAPDRPAIAYAGDGAWGMSMVEILTAVRHDIPVTAVVFHNRQWGPRKRTRWTSTTDVLWLVNLTTPALPISPSPWGPKAWWWTGWKTWVQRSN